MPCVNGTIYLVDGQNIKEGIVLLCSDGEWYLVCGDRWSDTEAGVVCSTLGYSAKGSQGAIYLKHIVKLLISVLINLLYSVSINSSFTQDASKISLQDIHCSGNETTLSDCDATEYNPMECTYLAKVICDGMYCPLTIVHVLIASHKITVPCHSNGCNKCVSQEDCLPIPGAQCDCTSDCYSIGTCCPDVGYLRNCFGKKGL